MEVINFYILLFISKLFAIKAYQLKQTNLRGMTHCKICKSVTTRNKSYCTNACRQRAYRIRRNVPAFGKIIEMHRGKPIQMEYELVKERIKKESYPFVKLSYHEYAFVRESHPEIDSVSLLTEVILDIKKKLDYSHIESPQKQAFNNYLKRKLNH